MRVGIIGAGPAGITAAYQLSKAGACVDVFEAGGHVGGLSRTIDLWGQKVDLGPHRFFSQDRRVNDVWLDVVGADYRMVDRLTRILYKNRFFHYPLRPSNALWNMGLVNAVRCLTSYFKEKVLPSVPAEHNDTFESWVVGRFGRRLFDMFFKSYSEKLWGIPCHQLDADFAAQRIKKFSLGEAIKAALGIGKQNHKTLVDQFAYPTGGTGMIYERMAQRVEAMGGTVHLKAPVRRLLHRGTGFLARPRDVGRPRKAVPHYDRHVDGLELVDGRTLSFDHVISTMPLTLLVKGLGDLPEAVQQGVDKLRFRNTILVYLNVDNADLFKDQWLYVHSPELGMGRVTNFRNWAPELYGDSPTSILALEYWCYDEDPIWRESDGLLIERASREIRATGLVGKAEILAGHVQRIRRCYPVYSQGYKKHLQPVIDHLRQYENLHVIGRYGAFKYNNQDHSILMGVLAAENIVAGREHDLWAVNTDSDYQEAATITRTGLERVATPPQDHNGEPAQATEREPVEMSS